jgi:branched-chain amino acid transport system permease protein
VDYLYSILVLAGIYLVLSSSFDLIIGYGGLISIAHPTFYAIGAYTAGLLAIAWHLPALPAVVAGGLLAMIVSMAMSLPAIRVAGDYLLIASIGFQLGLLQVIKNVQFTGGDAGLSDIPPAITGPFRSQLFAAISLALGMAAVLLIGWIVRGPYGAIIMAMRDDELALQALGRNVTRIKVVIFALGSGLAGLAGGVYAFYYQYLSPSQFDVLQSAAILTMVVIGGMGTAWGPVVGTFLLLGLPQAITFLHLPPSIMAPFQGILFCLLVLLFIQLRPQGIIAARRPGQ